MSDIDAALAAAREEGERAGYERGLHGSNELIRSATERARKEGERKGRLALNRVRGLMEQGAYREALFEIDRALAAKQETP